jgi:hypothetical protein|tara:strand:- start:320 stop:715 length:396 start_codon:yes stop_codon:yes gene_type:complete
MASYNLNKRPCGEYYCDANVGCPKGCGGCKSNYCSSKSDSSIRPDRQYRRFTGAGQTPLNNQSQWSNNGLNNQVFVGANGENETHTMPDGTVMPGASHSEGYGSIFSEKNYWIGVAAGVLSLLAYQKYFKK